MSENAPTVRGDFNRLVMLLHDAEKQELAVELASDRLAEIEAAKAEILGRLYEVLPPATGSVDRVVVEAPCGTIIEFSSDPEMPLDAWIRHSHRLSSLPEYGENDDDDQPSHSVNPDVQVVTEDAAEMARLLIGAEVA